MRFQTVADKNPCPVCGRPPQNLPGILLRNGDIKSCYFVCWKDGMAKKRARGETWIRLRDMAGTA